MNADQYLAELQSLLPPGAAFTREPGAVLTRLLDAFAQELARLDAAAESVLEEADPRTTTALLADWERSVGLPDDCITTGQSMQERRDALVARITGAGGQSRQFFIDLAASLGYTITITEMRPFQVGVSAVGDNLYDQEWRFVWQVNAPAATIREFAVGESAVGDALRTWGNAMLECAITKLKPAHTLVQFSYA